MEEVVSERHSVRGRLGITPSVSESDFVMEDGRGMLGGGGGGRGVTITIHSQVVTSPEMNREEADRRPD